MVGHEAAGKNHRLRLVAGVPHEAEIGTIVTIIEENQLPAVSALREVMRIMCTMSGAILIIPATSLS